MGNQSGNLRAQLVADEVVADLNEAKEWMRKNLLVIFTTLRSDEDLRWAEHFMLAVLRPRYSD